MFDFQVGEKFYLKVDNGLVVPVQFVSMSTEKGKLIVSEPDGDEIVVRLDEVAKFKEDLLRREK